MDGYNPLPGGFFYKVVKNISDVETFNSLVSANYVDVFAWSNFRLLSSGTYQDFLKFTQLKHPLEPQDHPILIYDSNRIPIAGLKLVLPGEYELPIEQDFGLTLSKMNLNKKKVGEIGKFCVLESWRGAGPLIRAIYHAVSRECIKNKVDTLLAGAIPNLFLMYRKIGFDSLDGTDVPKVGYRFGIKCIPCKLDISMKIEKEFRSQQEKRDLSEQRTQQILDYLGKQYAFQ